MDRIGNILLQIVAGSAVGFVLSVIAIGLIERVGRALRDLNDDRREP